MKTIDPIQIAKKKNQILDIAEKIIAEEGIEGLSIRKIALHLKQTPGIMYHYFENKEEIVSALVQRGYREILMILQKRDTTLTFEKQFTATITSYMKAMIAHKEVFILLLQSKDPRLQEQTQILSIKNIEERKSMAALIADLEKGIELKLFLPIDNIEMYAKLLWCSMYGVMERCIVENITPEEATIYVDNFMKIILKGLKGN